MRALTAGELARLQDTQESAMLDRCTLLIYQTGAHDAYGMPTPVYNIGASLACGYDATARKEVSVPSGAAGGTQVAITDAVLRLPVSATVGNKDRVKITHRLGELLSVQPVYELIGEPRRGPSGLVLNLRSVVE